MTAVTLDHVGVEIDGRRVLHDVSFDVADRTFAGLAGPSGSGKTTLLRVIAGLQAPTVGRVLFDGVDVTDLGPAERNLGMAFQEPALLPHRRVERNVAFPLEIRHRTAEEIRRRVNAEARAQHIEHLLMRHPDELSAGEAHLVQIARTMVRVPTVLLLDEPLANLDPPLKASMRRELAVLQAGYGVTAVVASNEAEDFLAMCSQMVVVDGGEVLQIGAPLDVREAPAALEAAQATGDLSVVEARVVDEMGVLVLVAEGDDASVLRLTVTSPAFADRVGESVIVAIRPWAAHPDPAGRHRARVVRHVPWPRPMSMCLVAGDAVLLDGTTDAPRDAIVSFSIDEAAVFDATSGRVIAAV